VAHGVILEHELAGHRRIRVERGRSGLRELLVAERADRLAAAALLARTSSIASSFVTGGVVDRVLGVQRVHVVHGQTGERFAIGDVCAMSISIGYTSRRDAR
jgi:hypothetical protein